MTSPILHARDFEGLQGQVFRVSDMGRESVAVELTLTSVTSWGPDVAEGRRQPFTLLFHGSLAPVLPQMIYRFDHRTMGSLEIFIVPIGPDQDAMQYEAVFA